MPKFYDSISDELKEWCAKQSVFWTGTAPLVGKHINVSPKGVLQSGFAVLGPNKAAYVDLTGSGSETICHLYENGRITILFSSFEKSPRILRLYCTGSVVETGSKGFDVLLKQLHSEHLPGVRAVIVLDVWKVQISCGFGVPVLAVKEGTSASGDGSATAFLQDRETIARALAKMEKKQVEAYWQQWCVDSLDGLPGMQQARRRSGERLLWVGDAKSWARRALATPDVLAAGLLAGLVAGALAMGTLPGLTEHWRCL